MKKWPLWILAFILLFIFSSALLGAWAFMNVRDRHPGYVIDINKQGDAIGQIQAGFARKTITPAIVDTWTDSNGDSRYIEEDGDIYQDNNGNGKFDAYWIAGFANRRPANGVHDQLWARAMVIDDGNLKIALVALDAIGFGSDDVIALRKQIPETINLDYCIVTSTHTHEAPDLIGIWGESEYSTGINSEYLRWVQAQGAAAVTDAANKMRTVKLRFGQDLDGAIPLVDDTRLPFVLDPGIRLMQVEDLETDETLGTLFAWADHPETLWDKNLLLTSDFPHYVREFTENGIYHEDTLFMPGLGGITIYVNGSIGGLMTTHPDMEIMDPLDSSTYREPSFEKAEALGKTLAMLALKTLHDSTLKEYNKASISLVAKTIEVPLDNPLFRLGALMGVLQRGMTGWFKMRSEVSAWRIGPASFLHVPGEIYPEIVNGGVEAPEGNDFNLEPQEIPSLRSLMPGKYKFVVGLSNDMIGYIIPKSEWDENPPHIYNEQESPYGEINSVSPEVGPIIHAESVRVLGDLKKSVNVK